VSDESEAMFMSRARGSMGAEQARDRLDRQSPQRVNPAMFGCRRRPRAKLTSPR
jgi:hypothetical protein